MKNNGKIECFAKNSATNSVICADNGTGIEENEERKPLCSRKSVSLICILAICAAFCLSFSGCALVSTVGSVALAAKKKSDDAPKYEVCTDFYSSRQCEDGIRDYASDEDDSDRKFDKYSIWKAAKNLNLTGDEASLYIANAKVQDLTRIYSSIQTRCQEKFASHLDKCLGYGLNITLHGRENAYLTTGDYGDFDFEGDYNEAVVPTSDDEYLTSVFQGYYDALSDEAKALVEIDKFAMTPDRLKNKKIALVNSFKYEYSLDSLPIGYEAPELEALVVDYLARMNPELKVKAIVFDQKWNVNTLRISTTPDEFEKTGKKYTETTTHKERYAVVTVEHPLDPTKIAVLGYAIQLKMDHEGGGNYGEPYCAMMEQIRPKDHKIDFYSNNGFTNVFARANDGKVVTDFFNPTKTEWIHHYIDYDYDRKSLYNYHAVDKFLIVKE